jgi:hemoglobin-like flavoprotein
MTPEQIALVQESFRSLRDHGDELTRHFYERLFALDPAARDLFPADLDGQRVKFFEELGEIVASIRDLGALVDRVSALGARHAQYGVRMAQYGQAGDALIGALRDTTGAEVTAPVIEAWSLAYNLVAESMMRGAGRAPSPPTR